MNSDKKNYYEVLEIPTNANLEEIYEGHIRIKNAYSSDTLAAYSLMDKSDCKRILEDIEEAYMVLSDENKKKQYDKIHNINNETGLETSQYYSHSRKQENTGDTQ